MLTLTQCLQTVERRVQRKNPHRCGKWPALSKTRMGIFEAVIYSFSPQHFKIDSELRWGSRSLEWLTPWWVRLVGANTKSKMTQIHAAFTEKQLRMINIYNFKAGGLKQNHQFSITRSAGSLKTQNNNRKRAKFETMLRMSALSLFYKKRSFCNDTELKLTENRFSLLLDS